MTPVSTAPSLPASQFTVCTSRFTRSQEMLVVSYVALQPCISFLKCFRQKWHASVFKPCWHIRCRCSYNHMRKLPRKLRLRSSSSNGEHPGDHNHQDFPKVLQYKWEAYCNTDGGRTAIQMGGVLTTFPFPQSVGAPEVLRYKLEAYCNTNGRRIAILL